MANHPPRGGQVGARSKRTPEARANILETLMAGNTLKVAASAGGMSFQTFNEWRHDDPEFAEAVERAEHYAQMSLLGIIRNAAERGQTVTVAKDGSIITRDTPGEWTAAAWLAERRWPQDYGRRDTVRIDITAEVRRYAEANGLDPDSVLAEAEQILAGKS